MSDSPLTAAVLVDGERVADTGAEFIEGVSTVLTGASVVWGRSTVVDQPETSTATCTIARRALGAAGFLAGLRVGATLDLTAAGTSYPDPTVSTFLDPGFETGDGPHTAVNADAGVVPPQPSTLTTNLVGNPSMETASGTAEVRRNLAAYPDGSAFSTGSGTVLGWRSDRYGGANGTYSLLTGQTTPVPGLTTAVRYVPLGAPPTMLNRGFHLTLNPESGTVTPGTGFPVTPGEVLTLSCYLRLTAPGLTAATAAIRVRAASDTAWLSGDASGAVVSLVGGGWVRVSITYTVGAGATQIGSYVTVRSLTGVATAGDALDGTGLLVERNINVVRPYFDGARQAVADADLVAVWTGAAGSSPSILRGVGVAGLGTGGMGTAAARIQSSAWATRAGTKSARVIPLSLTNADIYIEFAQGGVNGFPPLAQLLGKTLTVLTTVRLAAPQTGSLGAAARAIRAIAVAPGGNVVFDSPQAPNAAGAYPLALTFTVPADTTYLTIRGYGHGPAGSGETWWDDALIVLGEYTGPYFDGSTPDVPGVIEYAWTGAANASTSTATTTAVGGWFEFEPIDGTRAASVALAPAPFVPFGTEPDAWDAIPTTSLGQVWGYGIDVLAPEGAVVTVHPVLFGGPWPDRLVVLPDTLTLVGDGAWHTLAGEFLPNVAGAWVGVQVVSDPTGHRWVDLDPVLAWVDTADDVTWRDLALVRLDDVLVLAPAAGTVRTVLVFSGRITDLQATYDDSLPGGGGVSVEVTAQDFTADLANVRIGDVPWQVERLDTRVDRILDLAATVVEARIDPSLADTLVTYRDVDSQPAAGLVVELAQSVDGVLWSATHQTTGPFYWLEDPAQRPALARLALVEGVVVIVAEDALAGALRLSSCDALRDPIEWVQDVSDVSTRVDVTWLEQGVDDDGKPTTTERHVVVVDDDLEALVGQRGVSLSTQLQAHDDAADVAGRLLSRITASGWRLDGLVWDTRYSVFDAADVATGLDLLDGTTRIGRTLVLTELPDWSPAGPDLPLYVEGGTWTFEAGWWVFDLTTSSSAGGQGVSALWQDLPDEAAWSWDAFAPEVTWSRMHGVAGPRDDLAAAPAARTPRRVSGAPQPIGAV